MKVIFREYKKSGNIIAIFPTEQEINNTSLCYEHIGQHGAMCKEFYLKDTKPTQNYNELLNELINIAGYKNLNIVTKLKRATK